MRHARQQIRERVKDLLDGRSPLASVVLHRDTNAERDALPCAAVWIREEEAEAVALGANARLERDAVLVVEVLAKATGSDLPGQEVEAVLDECALTVEKVLAESGRLGGLLKGLRYLAARLEHSDDQREARLEIQYLARYHALEQNPETID